MLITIDANKLTYGQLINLSGMVTNQEDYEALKHRIRELSRPKPESNHIHKTILEAGPFTATSPSWCLECHGPAQPSCEHH